jgi:hypothetical protein
MITEWPIKRKCKEAGGGLFLGNVPKFVWRDWRKPRNTSVSLVGVRADIRNSREY